MVRHTYSLNTMRFNAVLLSALRVHALPLGTVRLHEVPNVCHGIPWGALRFRIDACSVSMFLDVVPIR